MPRNLKLHVFSVSNKWKQRPINKLHFLGSPHYLFPLSFRQGCFVWSHTCLGNMIGLMALLIISIDNWKIIELSLKEVGLNGLIMFFQHHLANGPRSSKHHTITFNLLIVNIL